MEDTKLTSAELKTAEEVVGKIFELLELDGTFTVEQGADALSVVMETKDTGMIIGYHGEGLESLQLVISLAISKKVGRFVRVSIEVDGYKEQRTQYLHELAIRMKEKALAENKEQVLMSLKSWERRIVHLFLQEDDEVVSESAGEGRDRVLVIKPKN